MSDESIPASLLRQWAYCPRIPFIREVLGHRPAMPAWVARGEDFDAIQHALSRDRRFRELGAFGWQRLRRVELRSEEIGIHGTADLILRGPDRFLVCDFKLEATRIERGARLQLGAYALMAERQWGVRCHGLAVLTRKPVRALLAPFDDLARESVRHAIERLRATLEQGALPPSDAGPAKCGICEHLNHCNDRE